MPRLFLILEHLCSFSSDEFFVKTCWNEHSKRSTRRKTRRRRSAHFPFYQGLIFTTRYEKLILAISRTRLCREGSSSFLTFLTSIIDTNQPEWRFFFFTRKNTIFEYLNTRSSSGHATKAIYGRYTMTDCLSAIDKDRQRRILESRFLTIQRQLFLT